MTAAVLKGTNRRTESQRRPTLATIQFHAVPTTYADLCSWLDYNAQLQEGMKLNCYCKLFRAYVGAVAYYPAFVSRNTSPYDKICFFIYVLQITFDFIWFKFIWIKPESDMSILSPFQACFSKSNSLCCKMSKADNLMSGIGLCQVQ